MSQPFIALDGESPHKKNRTICNNHTCHGQNTAGWGIVIPPSLVGGFNPSEKYEFVSWDDDIPNKWKVIKVVFETTNQIMNNGWDFPACRLRWENRHKKNKQLLTLTHTRCWWPRKESRSVGGRTHSESLRKPIRKPEEHVGFSWEIYSWFMIAKLVNITPITHNLVFVGDIHRTSHVFMGWI